MNITGVTLGWHGKPCLEFDDRYVLPRDIEMMYHEDCYTHGEWPRYPNGERIPISPTQEWDDVYWRDLAVRVMVDIMKEEYECQM